MTSSAPARYIMSPLALQLQPIIEFGYPARVHQFLQVLKRAAVQTDAAAAAVQLLQLESLCGPFDCFVEARKRFAASARVAPAAIKAPAAAAASKVAKKMEEDIPPPSAKRPRASTDTFEPTSSAAPPRKEFSQRDNGGCEELTLHVKHAFEIRELSLRKL